MEDDLNGSGGRVKTKLKLHSSQQSWSWDELGKILAACMALRHQVIEESNQLIVVFDVEGSL